MEGFAVLLGYLPTMRLEATMVGREDLLRLWNQALPDRIRDRAGQGGERLSYRDRKLGALPLGELHDAGKCARCGIKGEVFRDHVPEYTGELLMRTVLVSTHAVAVVCKDTHACLRRRTNKKKGRG